MLASSPASMVNQKRPDLGIPNRFKLTSSRSRDDMFTIVMMQAPSQRGRIQTEIRQLIYEALTR